MEEEEKILFANPFLFIRIFLLRKINLTGLYIPRMLLFLVTTVSNNVCIVYDIMFIPIKISNIYIQNFANLNVFSFLNYDRKFYALQISVIAIYHENMR